MSQSERGPVTQPTDDSGGAPSTSILVTSGTAPMYDPTPLLSKDEGDASPVESQKDLTGKYKEAKRPEDSVDARFSGMAIGDNTADTQHRYRMDYPKRGLFIIINNKKFHQRTQMGERTGTDNDAANLYTRFKELGFDVKLYSDLKAEDMLKVMIEASKKDHSDSDCFAVAILSHGDEGIVYGTDAIIKIDSLVAPLKGDKCPTLVGKPKLFFIQACRGAQLDHGVEQHDAMVDQEAKTYRIPAEADFVYAYSTVAGYFSWRNSTKGSWFVQALCRMLQKHGTDKDIMWILTRVNHEVAYEFESNASKEFMNRKKQVPSIVSMLTKDLVFTPK